MSLPREATSTTALDVWHIANITRYLLTNTNVTDPIETTEATTLSIKKTTVDVRLSTSIDTSPLEEPCVKVVATLVNHVLTTLCKDV